MQIFMNNFLVFLFSFLIVYSSTPLMRKIAVDLKILDLPSRRKIHKRAMPLLGGLAIYLGFILGLLFDLKGFYRYLPILIGATLILIVGLVHDIKGLSAQFRLFCQLLAALAVIGSGMRISFLPAGLWGDASEIILTLIWIVGVTNAFNYLDGMDGLAAGSAVVNLFCFAFILYVSGQAALGRVAILLAAGCLGFLPYNLKRAKIFLGDAGSMFLGFNLAGIALIGNWAQDNIVKISIPVLILGVPIFDMIFTTIMRIREAKIKTMLEWLQYGGKDHFHHYLVDLGMQPLGAVVFIYFVTLSLGISAVMVSNDRAFEAFLTLTQASIIFGIIAALIVVGRRHRSGWA